MKLSDFLADAPPQKIPDQADPTHPDSAARSWRSFSSSGASSPMPPCFWFGMYIRKSSLSCTLPQPQTLRALRCNSYNPRKYLYAIPLYLLHFLQCVRNSSMISSLLLSITGTHKSGFPVPIVFPLISICLSCSFLSILNRICETLPDLCSTIISILKHQTLIFNACNINSIHGGYKKLEHLWIWQFIHNLLEWLLV